MSPDAAPIIDATALRKVYGSLTAVDGIDVQVPRGSCFGLLGPNGAGKTTFLRMVVGRTPPTAGRLTVLGHAVPEEAGPMRARLGMVPQLDNLDPDFTVVENLRTYARYFGLHGAVVERRIADLLDFATLGTRADSHIKTLSGGMQRRLSLCRALVNDPELLILDEPTTGLDPQARQLIWQRLRQLRARGMTLVLTTHYLEEAERLCDQVAIMDHGRILDRDTPTGLVGRHVEPHVVEVHGPGLDTFHARAGERLAERSELVGE
ncbi:MAG: ATP-binding cassette domain-containing protein, partial [Planctomycetes bacterium]|nr:ATP-binding cassette domain-containing protein [Planctomycetota bacterium]